MDKDLVDAVIALDETRVLDLVAKSILCGRDANALIADCRTGLGAVGERFQKGEYFLIELIRSADIFKKAMVLIEPLVAAGGAGEPVGKVVIGTPQGDIHDIGKNIVGVTLRSSGFEVYDLGVDVPTKSFVEAVDRFRPDIVAMSALLTTAFLPMKEAISTIRAMPHEWRPKVIIGGGPVDERVREFVDADAFAVDAVTGVEICKGWIEVREGRTHGK